MRYNVTVTRIAALIALLIAAFSRVSISAAESAPVNCVFDLSAVIADSDHLQSVQRRLFTDLVPELRGDPSDSKAKLRLSVAIAQGRFVCHVFLTHGRAREKLVGRVTVDSLAELAAVANRQTKSEELWMGRLTRSADSEWSVEAILPSAPAPRWLTTISGGGIYRVIASPEGKTKQNPPVERVTGPELAEASILVPVHIERSNITIAIRDSNDFPLSDIELYAQPESFPDPGRLGQSSLVGTTDHNGTVQFPWEHLGPVYLLAVRDSIPLKNLSLLPTQASLKRNFTIPSRWRLRGDIVSLDKYILAKRRDFAVLREERKRREETYSNVKTMIDGGQWDAALKVLDTLGANDPIAQQLRHNVLAQKEGATIAELLHAADLAIRDKDYAAGKEYMEKAIDLAKGDQKAEIADRLRKLDVAAEEFHRRTGSATRLLFLELPRLSIGDVISRVSQIEDAVSVLCTARFKLRQAADQLKDTISVLDIAMAQRLKEMERLQIQSDAQYTQMENARNRLHGQLERVSNTMKSATSDP